MYFPNIPVIPYEGPNSTNPMAFKFYNPDRVIMGKTMKEHLPFAMAWWHNLCAAGTDMFGRGTADKSFGAEKGTMEHAKAKVDAGFEFMQKLGIEWVKFTNPINLYISGAIDATLVKKYNEQILFSMSGITPESVLKFSDIGFDYSYIMAATGDRVPCVWVENERVVGLDPADPIEVSYRAPFEGEPLGKTHPELLTKLHPSVNHGHDQAIVNGISRIGYMKGGHRARWEDENIADSITAKAVNFIEQHSDEPFFLYLGTNDIHVPRYPHSRFVGTSGMGMRGDAIMQFDWTVGQVLDALQRCGISDNTLIILTSDNGPVVDDGYADQSVELLGDHRPWGDLRGGK